MISQWERAMEKGALRCRFKALHWRYPIQEYEICAKSVICRLYSTYNNLLPSTLMHCQNARSECLGNKPRNQDEQYWSGPTSYEHILNQEITKPRLRQKVQAYGQMRSVNASPSSQMEPGLRFFCSYVYFLVKLFFLASFTTQHNS
jgi:hypothetical protein